LTTFNECDRAEAFIRSEGNDVMLDIELCADGGVYREELLG
jgi:hypothetical protein